MAVLLTVLNEQRVIMWNGLMTQDRVRSLGPWISAGPLKKFDRSHPVVFCNNIVIYWLPIYIYIYLQGDSGGICETSGNDSMCDSKQKCSYKHVSDFRRLRIYGHFLFPTPLMWTAFTEPAGGIMNSASLVASTRYLDCGEGGVS